MRDTQLNVMVSAEEKAQIKENAAYFAMTFSDYVRHVALGGTIDWDDHRLRRKARVARAEVAA